MVLLILSWPLLAQNLLPIDSSSYFSLSDYSIEHYDGRSGFAQNSIHGMYMDNDDVLWLNNHSGISSFDGGYLQHFSGPSLTPLALGITAAAQLVPKRKKDGLHFLKNKNNYNKIFIKPNLDIGDWDMEVEKKLPSMDSLKHVKEFYWERNDGSAYYVNKRSVYYKQNNNWHRQEFQQVNIIFLWQIQILGDALFIIHEESKNLFEYRDGKCIAIHRFPFLCPDGLGGADGIGYGKYFHHKNAIYELNADVPGKPKLILKLKLNQKLPTMYSFLEDTISGNLFWGTLNNGFIRFKEKPFVSVNKSTIKNATLNSKKTLYLPYNEDFTNHPQKLINQLKNQEGKSRISSTLIPLDYALQQQEYLAYSPTTQTLWKRSYSKKACSFYQFTDQDHSWKRVENQNLKFEALHFIYTTSNGVNLFTTANGGLWSYKNEQLKELPMDGKGFLEGVYQIGEDNKGFLWINTAQGAVVQASISEINKYIEDPSTSLYYKTYKPAFFNSNEKPDLGFTPTGKLVLEFKNEFISINPKYTSEKKKLNIFIQSIEVNEKSAAIDSTLTLNREFGLLKYAFSVPYWFDRENLNTEYLLSGRNAKWSFFNLNDKLQFQLLNPGKYTLKIRARSGFGKYSTAEKEISFTVLPYWYESNWFRVLFVLSILGILTAIYFYRLNRIKKRKLQLSKLIKEKRLELGELNATLSLNNLQLNKSKREQEHGLQERDEIVNLYTSKLRNPLKKVSKILLQLKKTKHDKQIEECLTSLKKVEEIAEATYSVTESFFNWIREKEGLVPAIKIEIVFREVLEDILLSYKDSIQEKKLRVVYNIPSTAFIISEPNATTIILDIIINNAVQYSTNGKIEFSLTEQDEFSILKIKDEGIGMDSSKIEKSTSSEGKGFGLSAASNLMYHLGGLLKIESIPNVGTQVYLYFKKQSK